mmetsp:Transcript_221/g.640  ORF Transcript_221/g.640 Transcript_221/m.640 type:complete len:206 (-) Transcript_221:790-1407(-)
MPCIAIAGEYAEDVDTSTRRGGAEGGPNRPSEPRAGAEAPWLDIWANPLTWSKRLLSVRAMRFASCSPSTGGPTRPASVPHAPGPFVASDGTTAHANCDGRPCESRSKAIETSTATIPPRILHGLLNWRTSTGFPMLELVGPISSETISNVCCRSSAGVMLKIERRWTSSLVKPLSSEKRRLQSTKEPSIPAMAWATPLCWNTCT